LFQDNKGSGKDALKFAKDFQLTINHTDTTTVGPKEDFYPAGAILKEFGHSFADFKDADEALAAVKHLCDQNKAEHGYEEKTPYIDDKFPQFSKFWFVKSLAKTHEHAQLTAKELKQNCPLKNVGQLEQAKLFMEGMGFNEEASTSNVKIENEKAGGLKKEVELIKLPY
jgi:hypothetical protein